MKIRDMKKTALATLKGKWLFAVLLTVIVFAITELLPTLVEILVSGGFAAWINQEVTPWNASLASNLVGLLLIPFLISNYYLYLDLIRQKDVKLTDLFTSIQNSFYFKIIGLWFLYTIKVLLWSLLLIVPGFIKSISYSQAFYILKDNPEIGLNEALQRSKKMMKGHKVQYFLFGLSFIGWFILAVIPLGLGLLWLAPYTSAAMACYYENLKELQTNEPQPESIEE